MIYTHCIRYFFTRFFFQPSLSDFSKKFGSLRLPQAFIKHLLSLAWIQATPLFVPLSHLFPFGTLQASFILIRTALNLCVLFIQFLKEKKEEKKRCRFIDTFYMDWDGTRVKKWNCALFKTYIPFVVNKSDSELLAVTFFRLSKEGKKPIKNELEYVLLHHHVVIVALHCRSETMPLFSRNIRFDPILVFAKFNSFLFFLFGKSWTKLFE